eukprot:CAMPEP_0174708580 /NCGR_PEP_ID=MMETSP1094-20130205/10791_1 /TAXON_ID=156173 /ORGANISM="Chrysochromulina brevifilum, Strain UTEX LB 985" /LENGTH=181 /DNA_ID=CAMNT_0015907157 /DNA_START=133 /DNA_END=678 /DNA_ORIENTATION=-
MSECPRSSSRARRTERTRSSSSSAAALGPAEYERSPPLPTGATAALAVALAAAARRRAGEGGGGVTLLRSLSSARKPCAAMSSLDGGDEVADALGCDAEHSDQLVLKFLEQRGIGALNHTAACVAVKSIEGDVPLPSAAAAHRGRRATGALTGGARGLIVRPLGGGRTRVNASAYPPVVGR